MTASSTTVAIDVKAACCTNLLWSLMQCRIPCIELDRRGATAAAETETAPSSIQELYLKMAQQVMVLTMGLGSVSLGSIIAIIPGR